MDNHFSSNDSVTRTTFNEDTAVDITRLQGEELVRLRKEPENAQVYIY